LALNFTVSYTFSPSTTIASAQVNTNTTDVANVFNGLEALTKSFAKLKVDVDPATALEVAVKQYVDHYSTWRRPNLINTSSTVVDVESGLDGTSGDCVILFPDGSTRNQTTTTPRKMDITRNASLSGTKQGGLRTSTAAANTWYAIYAVKATDDTTSWCAVGDTILPLQANYATLNTNFTTSGWVYLGMIRYGDNSGATTSILGFRHNGPWMEFTNGATTAVGVTQGGTRLATSASATTISWSFSAGTGATAIPNHIKSGTVVAVITGNIGNTNGILTTGTVVFQGSGVNLGVYPCMTELVSGATINVTTNAVAMDIMLRAFWDPVLGVGSNPIL
jgi:hypothetical protein